MKENRVSGFSNPWIWIITILLISLITWAVGITYSARRSGAGIFTDSRAIHNGYYADNRSLDRTPEDTGGMMQ